MHPSVSVENAEISRFLPVSDMLWLGEIQYNCDSIFIVLSHWSLVGGGRVSSDSAIAVFGVFGWLEVGDGGEYLGYGWMFVLIGFDSPFLNIEGLGLYEDFLPYDLLDLLCG